MQQLGLKSCPTCHLYYSEHSSGFNRHTEQCQANAPAVSRRKRARSPDPSESAAKRGRHEQPVYAFPYHPDRHLDEEVLLEQKENEGPIEQKEAQEPQVAVSVTDHTDSVTPTDIANHPKLLRKIPYVNRATFNTTMRRIFSLYTEASIQKDKSAQHDLIVEILRIPGQTMVSRRGGKKGKQRDIALMHHRLMQRHSADSSSSASQSSRPNLRSNSQAPIISSIARCVALTREGHYRRAVRAISSTSPLIDTSNPDKLMLLQRLHPLPLPHNSVLPVLSADVPSVVVGDDEGLVKIICQMANGAAPGPSGWTAEMVRVLTEDADCFTGLAMLIQDISNGALPDSVKPFLLPSILIGIDKNAGASVRPIAIGEIFYRIAAYRGQLVVQKVAQSILQPIQLGVGISGGCESIVHNLQHALELGDHPVAALAIDFKNAFNCVSRKSMLEALYSHPQLQYIWRLVDFAYSVPSDLYIRNGDGKLWPGIYSAQGVRQGDPLSSLLFALTIQPIYEAVVQTHPTLKATAIHDDITLVGPADDLASAYSTIADLADAIGLQVQPSKCQFIYFHNDTSPLSSSVHSFLSQHHIPLQQSSAIILGAPIGATIHDIQALAALMLKDQMLVLQTLLHDAMPIQEALLLLRISSTHKLDYLLRCVPPSAMEKSCSSRRRIFSLSWIVQV